MRRAPGRFGRAALIAVALACASPASAPATPRPAAAPRHATTASPRATTIAARGSAVRLARRLLLAAGSSLLARRVAVPGAGWAWPSAIQAPHRQTDRDVGAAGIASALLALYDVAHRTVFLGAARRAGDWLLAAAERTPAGLRWPDFVDPGGAREGTHFTAFDDGAPGIAESLWRLGVATGEPRFRRAALAGMRWIERRAEGVGADACPRVACRWRYADGPDFPGTYLTGIGEGDAGIVYALDLFARRTGKLSFARYARAGASYLESLITPDGALPWRPARRRYIVGFLGGAAGDAFLFLRLYQHTHERRWLRDAERLLGWVRAQALPRDGGLAWPIVINREPRRHAADNLQATGIEEGAAGIGWVELQAWELTRHAVDLQTALAAGRWLRSVALHEHGGVTWTEDIGRPLVHTGLDNGAAGIGWFLHDLWLATGERAFERLSEGAVRWLAAVARHDRRGIYWDENRTAGRWRLPREPSWHWGTAGIAGFLARMSGWPIDMPGEEPGFGSDRMSGRARAAAALEADHHIG